MNGIIDNSKNREKFRMSRLLRMVLLFAALFSGYSVMNSGVVAPAPSVNPQFDKAVEIIKKYEGLHKNHGNLVGYGHKIVAGEPYKVNQTLSEAEADKLLRKDLAALCEKYSSFGKDSLLLAALAYNCGIGVVAKSSILKKLQAGDRNIKESYLSYSRSRGKTLSQLQKRRTEEFEALFIP